MILAKCIIALSEIVDFVFSFKTEPFTEKAKYSLFVCVYERV